MGFQKNLDLPEGHLFRGPRPDRPVQSEFCNFLLVLGCQHHVVNNITATVAVPTAYSRPFLRPLMPIVSTNQGVESDGGGGGIIC